MDLLFQKHYSLEEARKLLPQVRGWLDQLTDLRRNLEEHDRHLGEMMSGGKDLGGKAVNDWVRCMGEMQGVLFEFYQRQIQIKDLERGLIDFPAFLGDKEVFLCWEKGEADIGFWHELEAGYAGRQRLE